VQSEHFHSAAGDGPPPGEPEIRSAADFDDRRIRELRRVLAHRPALDAGRAAHEREAAVALLVRPGPQLELLLIRRSEHEADPWSGHVALPGGRRDAADAALLHTALRETEEEVGIPLGRVGALLGMLDEVAPRNPALPPLVIAPFVLAVPPGTEAVPDRREIDAAIWVPLAALRSEEAVSEILIELHDGTRRFPSLVYGEYVIWGLTHRILLQFLELAEQAGL
jgi:8-oxo-dGTP pyrophosphatase MutT (NUDIX family)